MHPELRRGAEEAGRKVIAMKANPETIEKRIQNMKSVYLRTGELIDKLPKEVPAVLKNRLKDVVLGDKELKEFMEGVDRHRPPRILLVGRTGVGKSSLINAICDQYVAEVSHTDSCTKEIRAYQCLEGSRVLLEILDTRGIAESDGLDPEQSAEEQLLQQLHRFSPDLAILMLNATHRDSVNEDAAYMNRICREYSRVNKTDLPVVVVINKADEVAPARMKEPAFYPEKKIANIREIEDRYREIIRKEGLQYEGLLAVSSLIDWMTPEGAELTADEINLLPQSEKDQLQISFDGRYRIEELRHILEEAIPDLEARMGLRMARRLEEIVRHLAEHLTNVFTGLSAVVATTPIPVSDFVVLTTMQVLLVTMIAALSGREASTETAKEFLSSIASVYGVGYLFKKGAQQATKFANILFPGAGSAISAAIASTGTANMGKAAIAYYIDGVSMEEAASLLKGLPDSVTDSVPEIVKKLGRKS
ncbi:MAG: 50S ribosome-binding GTPase [Mogibacterium sp.]|nr:50S ribosome-binding GTPase [Mogibacterium sp.]